MEWFNAVLSDIQRFDLSEVLSTFSILFLAIDTIGSIPIILSLKEKGQSYNTNQVTLYSALMLYCFLFVGEPLIGFFGVDISSFGVAGGIVLLMMAVEMIFGIQIFKEDGPTTNATIVPLVFPLFAGPAVFTALLSLRSQEIAMINLSTAILINIVFIYLVLRFVVIIERALGSGGVYILRKFFGVLLLAISVKFITSNMIDIIAMVRQGVAAMVGS